MDNEYRYIGLTEYFFIAAIVAIILTLFVRKYASLTFRLNYKRFLWFPLVLVYISIPYLWADFGDLYFIRPSPKPDHEFVCGNIFIPTLFLQCAHLVLGLISAFVFYAINAGFVKENNKL